MALKNNLHEKAQRHWDDYAKEVKEDYGFKRLTSPIKTKMHNWLERWHSVTNMTAIKVDMDDMVLDSRNLRGFINKVETSNYFQAGTALLYREVVESLLNDAVFTA